MPTAADEFFLDPRLVRRSFDRASATYDAGAQIHSEIRARLLERLEIVRLQPSTVLDLGAGTGAATRALKQRYRSALVVAVDSSSGMLRQSSRQQSWLRRFERVAADAHRLPLKSASVDLVFSNLMLEWCHDPDAVFAEVRRVLRPGGLFTFATLGPDTLKELRESWGTIGRATHVHRFIDMHDFGDALMRARLAEPVMDTERLTITYPTLDALLDELKRSGSRNIAHGRARALTPQPRSAQQERIEASLMRNGRIAVSVEVVYGQAWAGTPRAADAGSAQGAEVRIPIGAIRSRR